MTSRQRLRVLLTSIAVAIVVGLSQTAFAVNESNPPQCFGFTGQVPCAGWWPWVLGVTGGLLCALLTAIVLRARNRSDAGQGDE